MQQHVTRKKTRFRAPASFPTQVPCNIHAAIAMRFAAPRTHSCTPYNAIRIPALQNRLKRSKPQPPHTGGALHRRLQPLHTEKHTVSCSGFLPSTSPMQHSCSHYHAAIKMRFAAPRTHPCSHYNAIRIPALQNTKGEPITRWNDPNRNRRTQEVPFITACSHFTRENTRFRAPASSPAQVPCNIHVAIIMLPLKCVLQHHVHIHAAITMRFASPRCRTLRGNRLHVETIQTATAAHRRYPSSPPAATLHGKTHGFVLRLPPQHKSHATFM